MTNLDSELESRDIPLPTKVCVIVKAKKTLILGGIGGRRRRGQWRMRWLDGNGYGFGWTLGVGDGQGGLACCGSWGRKESDTTEQLN